MQAKYTSVPIPKELKTIPDPPVFLYIRGENLEGLLDKPRLAIVGSRKMSPYGRVVTTELATACANQGIIIVSGLAYGVDACAQKAALGVGNKVIGVLACGLDVVYPRSHTKLAKDIVLSGGALVSEYPAKTAPLKHRFLERNRLIAGLADAVLITEAAESSGSLNTAAHALNQGKPVLAVPGNVHSPLSQGTNNLIKNGAHLISGVEDILNILGLSHSTQTALPIAQNEQEYILLRLLENGISDTSDLLRHSQLSAAEFNQTLTMLELTNKIKPLGNNQWSL